MRCAHDGRIWSGGQVTLAGEDVDVGRGGGGGEYADIFAVENSQKTHLCAFAVDPALPGTPSFVMIGFKSCPFLRFFCPFGTAAGTLATVVFTLLMAAFLAWSPFIFAVACRLGGCSRAIY